MDRDTSIHVLDEVEDLRRSRIGLIWGSAGKLRDAREHIWNPRFGNSRGENSRAAGPAWGREASRSIEDGKRWKTGLIPPPLEAGVTLGVDPPPGPQLCPRNEGGSAPDTGPGGPPHRFRAQVEDTGKKGKAGSLDPTPLGHR